MNQFGNEFVERFEDEAPGMKARVWQREKLCLHLFVFANQEVEIDGSRTHPNLARAAEGVLDAQQSRHDSFGRGKCRAAKLRDHVEKLRLVLVLDRLRLVDAREANHVEPGVEHAADGEQQVACAIAEV